MCSLTRHVECVLLAILSVRREEAQRAYSRYVECDLVLGM
jgi:hypothetical protein